jgi:hypothetical protein
MLRSNLRSKHDPHDRRNSYENPFVGNIWWIEWMSMMKTNQAMVTKMALPARNGRIRGWQRWTPYAAVVWSLTYGVLGIFWLVSGHGFPFKQGAEFVALGPLLGRFGTTVAWIAVILAGIPAAALGMAMLSGMRGKALRSLFITAGVLLAGFLMLLMTGLDLLIKVGYIPGAILGLLTAEKGQAYLEAWTQWETIHQLLCLLGGFLWLAATICYTRKSEGVCLVCGRRDTQEGWTSPDQSARWGKIAVVVAMVVPVFYAITRYAWALGFPLGMSDVYLRRGQERGTWIGGLFLATFCLVGALLMLGLVQRWGEVFPRWVIGLAGRRVPIALAVVPAALSAVLLIVGGIGIWSGVGQMIDNASAAGVEAVGSIGEVIIFQLGPTLLFPVWGVALAVATLGYYYRRRGPCKVCGRGANSLAPLHGEHAK